MWISNEDTVGHFRSQLGSDFQVYIGGLCNDQAPCELANGCMNCVFDVAGMKIARTKGC